MRARLDVEDVRQLVSEGLSDVAIAKARGVHTSAVQQLRVRNGIASEYERARAERRETALRLIREGFNDTQVGARAGLSRSRVKALRLSKGIPSNVKQGADLDVGEVRALASQGHLDSEVAERFGVHKSSVLRFRRRHGIPSGNSATRERQAREQRIAEDSSASDEEPGQANGSLENGFVAEPLGPHYFPVLAFTIDEVRRSACAGLDEKERDLFFPEAGVNASPAKKVCATCPLTRTDHGGNGRCLEIALANGERGVWGGTSERDRRGMRKQVLDAQAASAA